MKNIAIIGAGPAGYPCALKAAKLGAQVTLVESSELGGVCLNSGCIPSKALLAGAHHFSIVKELEKYSSNPVLGEEYFKTLSFSKLQEHRKATILRLRSGILKMLEASKVKVIKGKAKFVSENTLEIRGEKLTFDDIVIATGSRAFLPKQFESIKDKIYDNSTIFNLENLPSTLAILGGGVIACEFACLMQAFGVQVTIIEMQPDILPKEEETIRRTLKQILIKRGVKILTGTAAKEIKIGNSQKTILLDNGEEVICEEILAALGRRANTEDLNLEAAGINLPLQVNHETLEIKPHIYAIGDVNNLCQLAHAATAQGEIVAVRIMGKDLVYNNDLIPSAIYTWPEAANIGLSITEARAKGFEAVVKKSFLLANGRALAQGDSEGFAQIVEDKKTGKILGAQIVAPNAGEIIHIAL
ncbi:MAG: NAD(P)/FAD-dependent oxidoreductase, partial [Elusimicrobiaceae bacterium]|nr:NAD(P)/FAD-dependent oxidoreductase [Elusimicrobiaceae bacterium]